MSGIQGSLQFPTFQSSLPDYSSMFNYGVPIPTNNPPIDYSLGQGVALPTQVGTGMDVGGGWGSRPFFSMDSFLGGKNTDGSSFNGWGGMAMSGLQGFANLYNGWNQNKLGREQLALQRNAFRENHALQLGTLRGRVDDKARARYAANPGATGASSAGEYAAQQLARYGVA